MLDPAAPVLWAAHRGSAQTLDSALEVSGLEARVITGDAPSTPLIIGWDLPAPAQLAQLAAAAEVVLLVPPYAERFVRSMVPALQSLRLPGLMEVAAGEAAARRAEILRTLETGGVEPAVLTLAPLFERHDPTAVAAALYQLWTARTPVLLPTTPAAGSPAQAPVTARMWVGAGQKDGVTANDLVATLTREVGVDKGKIGKIEIRELYSLVELPAAEVERIAGATNGLTIRRRRVTARVDRGGRDARKEVRGKK
jgi:ATP-dependent RNA helicase DeaD